MKPFVVNISIPKSLYIYCFIFYIDIYYDYMYLLLGHVVFFVYYYSCSGNLPIKHWKSDLAKNYNVIDEISDYQRTFPQYICHFLFLYTVCVYACIITMYMYIHTKLIPLPQSTRNGGHYFFFIDNV